VVVRSDAEAREVVEAARRRDEPVPALGLLGGDLCRTLGGPGDEARLHSPGAARFPIDLGAVLLDGHLHWFCASLVAGDRWWRRGFWALNAQWVDGLNLGPRAHPGDGLLDTYEVAVPLRDLPRVRRRARLGAHLPYPGIKERRAPAVQVDLGRRVPVVLDGTPVGKARAISVRVEPEALIVVV
jgi:diacylglycerol kinase family enzyme